MNYWGVSNKGCHLSDQRTIIPKDTTFEQIYNIICLRVDVHKIAWGSSSEVAQMVNSRILSVCGRGQIQIYR